MNIEFHDVVIVVPHSGNTIKDRVADERDKYQRFCDKYGYILISWDGEDVAR